MTTMIIFAAWFIIVLLALRFFWFVHQCDEEMKVVALSGAGRSRQKRIRRRETFARRAFGRTKAGRDKVRSS